MLPAGLYDLLPPVAAHERRLSGQLLDTFAQFGYDQISPPLMEFEASLLAGRGAALASQTFRVMDPLSQDMLGFRADITMQVARIAATRLGDAPRPLRVSYGGSTLRIKGERTESARQLRQAGVELIGSASPAADAEVIAVAVQALEQIGCDGLVVDINLPGLVECILHEAGVDTADRQPIRAALECKDAGLVAGAGLGRAGEMLVALTHAAGGVDAGLQMLVGMALPDAAKKQVAHVSSVVEQLRHFGVGAELTLDPVENRGFEYHSLVSFSLFSRNSASEIGRGGRYVSAASGEAATGATLYVNALMELIPVETGEQGILVPPEMKLEECRRLQGQGLRTIRAETDADMTRETARAWHCTHIWQNGKAEQI